MNAPATLHGTAVITFPSARQIRISRRFNAPADLVFKVWTTPELVRRWWGFESSPLTVCDIDLRPGGTWRFATREPDGTELGWRGTYLEVEPPHLLVSTEVFEGYPDAEAENTLTLTEVDGVTELVVTVLHATEANRDGHVASGMESGLQHSLNRIDGLLTELQGTGDAGGAAATPSEVALRYRRVADRFTARVNEIVGAAWENPSPCDGWVARDVVRHLVEWVPAFLEAAGGPPLSVTQSVDTDPRGAWAELNTGIEAMLEDPVTAASTISHPHAGTHRLEDAIAMFFLGDIHVHTWDLARSAGLDETLDPDVTHDMLVGLEPLDEMLRASGQYGPRVAIAETADEQSKLLAFTGRTP